MKAQIPLMRISREDLLVTISKLKAENSLLRNNLADRGKDQALIQELEHKIEKRTFKEVEKLNKLIELYRRKIQNQRTVIKSLHKKRL